MALFRHANVSSECPIFGGMNRLGWEVSGGERTKMFSHVHVGIANFERSYAFYSAVMREMGFELKVCSLEQSWAGWIAPGEERPIFFIGLPYDRQPANAGNGGMTAFLASTRG